ncbi:hypothetical protein GO496_24440 [Acidovorax citrulli]|nr:hypothetical protein [Paracidovorax citrulli]
MLAHSETLAQDGQRHLESLQRLPRVLDEAPLPGGRLRAVPLDHAIDQQFNLGLRHPHQQCRGELLTGQHLAQHCSAAFFDVEPDVRGIAADVVPGRFGVFEPGCVEVSTDQVCCAPFVLIQLQRAAPFLSPAVLLREPPFRDHPTQHPRLGVGDGLAGWQVIERRGSGNLNPVRRRDVLRFGHPQLPMRGPPLRPLWSASFCNAPLDGLGS